MGDSVAEAKRNVLAQLKYKELGNSAGDYQVTYKFDMQSMLTYYKNIFFGSP